MTNPIQAFALAHAGLSDAEYNKTLKHPVECLCESCRKFGRYLDAKDLIEAWEGWNRGELS